MPTLTLETVCEIAGRAAAEVTRRDVARALLTVPSPDALSGLADLRRELFAAGNPLSAAFWDSATAVLTKTGEGAATVGDVRQWMEATGTEPTGLLSSWFLWPEESERGEVASQLHAELVAHLEGLVAAGTIDPDRLVAGDTSALTAYEQVQLDWLNQPLPDGRTRMDTVADEETDEFLAEWDAADTDARRILGELLADVESRPCPEADLRAVSAQIRKGIQAQDRRYGLLRAAGGIDRTALPEDDRELWLTLAAGAARCWDEPPPDTPYDDVVFAAWETLDHASWLGAIVTLARSGPGTAADADALASYAAAFDLEEEEEDDDGVLIDEDEDDVETHLSVGFLVVVDLWRQLGAVDEDERLTELGWWGIPEALERAWQPPSDDD